MYYIDTRGNWENWKLCEFLVFPIFTRVDVTVYPHGKCYIILVN